MAERSPKDKKTLWKKKKIACHKQFLIFLQCSQNACTADTNKPGLVWERVEIDTSRKSPTFNSLE